MKKSTSLFIVLLGATTAFVEYFGLNDLKAEQARILSETPQVSRVFSLEEELDTPKFRGQNSSQILRHVFSDSQLEDKYRQVVREYNQLSENPKIKSAVENYRFNETEAGCAGVMFGAGLAVTGAGIYTLLKTKE